ncbi:MAG: phosphotransacetylase, partial [Candidatus Marinimicrobia bacterium]|nr:phosphotransacetylase [Candidatus Neomarinimicrobiota bacterium]
ATIVLPEGTDERVVRAAGQIDAAATAKVILLGKPLALRQLADDCRVSLGNITTIDPAKSDRLDAVTQHLGRLSFAEGMSKEELHRYAIEPVHFGAALVALGDADGMVAGAATASSEMVRSAIRIVGLAPGKSLVSSIFLMISPDGESALTFADCGVVPDPDAAQLCAIASDAADFHHLLPAHAARVAFLSFSSSGSATHPMVDKPAAAARLFKELRPDIISDGELQTDAAIVPSVARTKVPGSALEGLANVLIFPDLNAGNIGYKLTERLGGYTALGPLLQGLAKPVHDLSRGCTVDDIVQIVAIAALQSAGSA